MAAQINTTDSAWDEAFLRVEGYLRAHRLESRVLLNRIATEIIQDARFAALVHPQEEPVKLAMEALHLRIGRWFARIGAEFDWTDERQRARGRLALVVSDLTGRWANYFLGPEPLPPELVAAMATFELHPGLELNLSTMPPAPLEFGFDDNGTPYPPTRNFWRVLRTTGSWLMIVGFFGIAWAASH